MNAVINFEELMNRRISHIQVRGEGIVTSILNDDTVGRKHQRFVLELAHHKTVMIINNIDIFPRLTPLEIGDRVEFFGEYIWNRHGGIVHWTHYDPKRKRDHGYVKVVADIYDDADTPIPLGTYRHYKDKLYEVIGFAVHSETLEDMVIYKALYGEMKTWVRPLVMWNELIETGNEKIKRFTIVEEDI